MNKNYDYLSCVDLLDDTFALGNNLGDVCGDFALDERALKSAWELI